MSIDDWDRLPRWQQRASTYLELSPHSPARSTGRRVLNALLAISTLALGVVNLATGRWLIGGVLVACGVGAAVVATSRTTPGSRLWTDWPR